MSNKNQTLNSDKYIFWLNEHYCTISFQSEEETVMHIPVNYQLSIFGKYTIPPTPETISVLMTEINENTKKTFLPNIISGQQVDTSSNQIVTIMNLSFITQDQQYSIIISNERIDVNYNQINESDINIEDFYKFATKALDTIIYYAKTASNRLAINIQQAHEIKSISQLNTIGKKIVKCVAYYNDKNFTEWSTQINSQINTQINNSQETLNIITEIASRKDETNQKPIILSHIDINTIPQNQNMRFNQDSLASFVKNAVSIAINLTSDIEGLILDD